ncbi:hypothetical protein Q31b_44760 [Novipirellula aureliae]|uniref:Tetratricopeptide repeat protein n=1 Tax=Novipirellula aureliae TaxID=2527966 RepID=A0A5C6DP82_9BACT|nr:hypothetical protein [Novipirellula aureliae]TWU37687.1 hypothetical protein Q31b_44760 [Novipirellula aureliae]
MTRSVYRNAHQPCLPFLIILVTASLFACAQAYAQNDTIYPLTGSPIRAAVVETTAEYVAVERGATNQKISSGEILKILFEGDPPGLTKGREFALDGQYKQALEDLAEVVRDTLPRKIIEEDWEFYVAYSQSQLALAGQADKKSAAAQMIAFASNHRTSWHWFSAAKVIGDLALALGNTDDAFKWYGVLRRAPSTTQKIQSVYLTGLAHFAAGDVEKAIAEFEKVIGINVQSAPDARLQSLAKAALAKAYAKQNQADKGLELVSSVIAELGPTDIEMSARAYNAQGANFESKGDTEGAILAYLHTHLMFSSQSDADAFALSRLAELWPKVGKPERAAAARQRLRDRYPGFRP